MPAGHPAIEKDVVDTYRDAQRAFQAVPGGSFRIAFRREGEPLEGVFPQLK
jgi:hypothetical protein